MFCHNKCNGIFYRYPWAIHPNKCSRRPILRFVVVAMVMRQTMIVSWWFLFCRSRLLSWVVVVVSMKWSSSSMFLSCRCHSHSLLPFSFAPIDDVPLGACPNVLVGTSNCNSAHCGICNDLMGGRLFVVCCKQHSNGKWMLLWGWSKMLLLLLLIPVRPVFQDV